MTARDHDPSLRCADAGSDIPRSHRREIDCPRCHQQCGWCSDYRWMHRAISLPGLPRQKCGVGDFEPEGDACPLCRGSRRVIAETTYEAARAGTRVAAQVDGASSRAEHDQ